MRLFRIKRSWWKPLLSVSVACAVVLLLVHLLGPLPRDFLFRHASLRGAHAWIDGDFVEVKAEAKGPEVALPQGRRPSPRRAIGLDFKGRLGNLIFQYASLIGIAEANNLIPVIPEDLELTRYFHLTAVKVPSYSQLDWLHAVSYTEARGCSFEEPTMKLGDSNDVMLEGYFQSWKYLQRVGMGLRRQLRFKAELQLEARAQIERLTSWRCPRSQTPCTYVGVHVRRGDMTSVKLFMDYGYVAAGADYILRAMAYFRSRGIGRARLVFVVVSDDPEWCRQGLTSSGSGDVVVADAGNSAAQDMAILAQMNHTIMSQGSFGWWAAWLAGGEVTYWKDYPRPGSQLDALFHKEDYYVPSWKPL